MPEGEIFTSSEYQTVYPTGIQHHFWNIARNDLIYHWLKSHLAPDDLVMDVGCGTGIVVNDLKSRGINIQGVELGSAPVMPGLQNDIQTGVDLFALDPSLKDRINVVLLLDVIEHIGDRRAFLCRIFRELPNCRLLFITVPARMELWSEYDRHWGHHLRYDRSGLQAELAGSGFYPDRTAYFFHWLYLVSRLMGLLGIAKSTEFQPIKPRGLAGRLHWLLGLITRLESRMVPGTIPGSSLACLALRPSNTNPCGSRS